MESLVANFTHRKIKAKTKESIHGLKILCIKCSLANYAKCLLSSHREVRIITSYYNTLHWWDESIQLIMLHKICMA